ncbi:MAG: hypothetical protein AB8H79_00285 [Myxococcota bacterium]
MPTLSLTRALAALLVVTAVGTSACEETGLVPLQRFISPLDGQTGWDPNTPLVIRDEGMSVPPDYPLPALVRVVDIDLGGFIEGRTERNGSTLIFTPDSAFEADKRYGWVVDMPEPVPHGPELVFAETLQEPAVFDTTSDIDVLAGTLGDDGQVCLVLSRLLTAEDTGNWSIEVDGERVDNVVGSLLDRTEWLGALSFPEGDDGVDVFCFDPPDSSPSEFPLVTDGARVRLYWGARDPWLIEVNAGAPFSAVERLRRGAQ